MAKSDRSEKAALLSELLGEARLADLRKSGVLPRASSKPIDPEAIALHRNRLIERFRERGLIGTRTQQPGHKPDARPPAPEALSARAQNDPKFSSGAIGARLAKHLDPERLGDEHPAVIALFLRSQSPQLRSDVLRALPGGQARAVMRILRSRRSGSTPRQSEPNGEVSSVESEEPMVQPKHLATVAKARTRRAR